MARTVGSRELKTRLGTFLRLVRQGKTFIVTDRGRPVAELRPLQEAVGDPGPLLQEMAALGEISRASASRLPSFTPAAVRGGPVSATIVEDRKDRA